MDIETQVMTDIARRQKMGIAKYGMTVADNPLCLHQWLQHAYEECLDMAVYLRRAMVEIDIATANPWRDAETTMAVPGQHYVAKTTDYGVITAWMDDGEWWCSEGRCEVTHFMPGVSL